MDTCGKNQYVPDCKSCETKLSAQEEAVLMIRYLISIGKLPTDLENKWEEIVAWLMGEGLTNAVNAKIDDMFELGTLAMVINDQIFCSLDERIKKLEEKIK